MRLLITIVLIVSILSLYFVSVNLLNKPIVNSKTYKVEALDSNNKTRKLESITRYNSIVNQALFASDREPFKVVEKKKQIKKKVVRLQFNVLALGVALKDGEVMAVIKDLRNGTISRLKINETINGWLLQDVTDKSLVFTQNGIQEIKFFKGEHK